jgi:hypothetical protein
MEVIHMPKNRILILRTYHVFLIDAFLFLDSAGCASPKWPPRTLAQPAGLWTSLLSLTLGAAAAGVHSRGRPKSLSNCISEFVSALYYFLILIARPFLYFFIIFIDFFVPRGKQPGLTNAVHGKPTKVKEAQHAEGVDHQDQEFPQVQTGTGTHPD